MTLVALFRQREVKGAFASEKGLFEIDLKLHRHVCATLRTIGVRLTATAAKHTSECTSAHSASEDRIEDVSEIDILEMGEVPSKIESARSEIHALMPKLIVTLALLVVRQHLVCLRRLLELGLGLFIARVAVGMVLHGKFAVCGLYLVRTSRLGYAKYLVIVSLIRHCAISPLSLCRT